MTVETAAFSLVHDFRGGAEALGPLLGKAGATLSHEVNPNYPTYKFGLADAVKASVLAADRRILDAFAAAMSCYPPVPMLVMPAEDASMAEMMQRCALVAAELGDVISKFQMRAADGEFSLNDAREVWAEIDQAIAALTAFRVSTEAHLVAQQKGRGREPAVIGQLG